MFVSHTRPWRPLTRAAGSGLAPEKSPHRHTGWHVKSRFGPGDCRIFTKPDCASCGTFDTIWIATSVVVDDVSNPITAAAPNLRTPTRTTRSGEIAPLNTNTSGSVTTPDCR